MICPVCSTHNRDDAKFCKGCGRSLRAEPPAELEVVVPEPPAAPPAPGATDDPSLAPTLILTPERMIAYHSRLWQRELEQEQEQQERQQGSARETPAEGGSGSSHIADLPTVLLAPATPEPQEEVRAAPAAPAAESEVAPARASSAEEEPARAEESVPPALAEKGIRSMSETSETPGTPGPAEDQPAQAEHEEEQPASQEVPQQEESASPASAAGPLESGTLVGGRYQVNALVHESEHERVYQVTDQQGYQHCWNCGSDQNAEGDEFCINCGAELLGASYLMHEFTPEHARPEELLIPGEIVNTFIEEGRTYAIEQPQAERDPFPEGVHLVAAALSDAGVVRRDEPNEDSTLLLLLQRSHESISQPLGIFIVADGMGGHASGQLASRIAVNTIAEQIVRTLLAAPLSAEKESQQPAPAPDEDHLVQILQAAVEEANSRLCQVNQQNKTDMGCTLTGFMVVGRHSYIVNVGDSRTYMVRGGQLYQRTTDHSLVGQLVAGGLIQPDEVYTHPQRSQIFRSLGDRPNVQIDLFKQELYPGDILLSCSDGLWEMVRDPQIESILNRATDPQTACAQLIEAANANGGDDNISAVVVFVR
jgi:serine/threonine protein phosphatase PrpC